eukprot:TRINITY_DN8939_c0_g1_i2.p1 TRINITY_DN8939_c0_g1~~TRINITY_DN8939_c0_g1_i2.p1  ORF type:complete len:173 (+),score=52.24 TRINITY_DN8939_c0_g1_i2:42-560(+)
MGSSTIIVALGIAGVLVSGYALDVEWKLRTAGPFYKPACDSEWGSCSAVFQSAYAHPLSLWGLVPKGHDLDLSLASAGLLNYGVYVLYPTRLFRVPYRLLGVPPHVLLMLIAVAGVGFSCYLLYVLKVILEDFCIVCATFHVINFSMFFFGALPEYRNPTIHAAALLRKKVE